MTRFRRELAARCIVEIERSADSLHAHAVPLDVAIRPGDVVLVHGAPLAVAYGERVSQECRATVRRAGPLLRLWTRAAAMLALTQLYEVGFETGEPI